jgi:hypothetical protein
MRDKRLHNTYALPNIIRLIKSRRMRWAGHVAHRGRDEKCTQYFDSKNLKGRDHSDDPSTDGRIILNGSYGNRLEWCEMDASGSE